MPCEKHSLNDHLNLHAYNHTHVSITHLLYHVTLSDSSSRDMSLERVESWNQVGVVEA